MTHIDRWDIRQGSAHLLLRELGHVPLIATDPPYSVPAGRAHSEEWVMTKRVHDGLAEATLHTNRMLCFAATSGRSAEAIAGCIRERLRLFRWVFWNKGRTLGRGLPGPFGWQTIQIGLFGSWGGAMTVPDMIVCPPRDRMDDGTTDHPAELPREVCRWLAKGSAGLMHINASTPTVVDPFCGTGELLRAWWELGYNCIGFDTSARAVAHAKERPLVSDEELLAQAHRAKMRRRAKRLADV